MFLNVYILFSFLVIQCLAGVAPVVASWYNCLDPGGRTGTSYSSSDIERAIKEAFRLAQDQEFARSSHSDLYPRHYDYEVQNWAGISINTNVDTKNLIEFPLVQGGIFMDGLRAGQDLVIIDAATGTFASVLTHRGVGLRGFRPCTEAHQPIIPDVAPYNPPSRSKNPLLYEFPFSLEGGSRGLKKEKLKMRVVEIWA